MGFHLTTCGLPLGNMGLVLTQRTLEVNHGMCHYKDVLAESASGAVVVVVIVVTAYKLYEDFWRMIQQ